MAPDLPCDDPRAGFAEYARVVLDALAAEPAAVVVGHSLGSDTIPLVAAARPVRRLVYLCPRVGGFARPAGEPATFRFRFPLQRDRAGRTSWRAEDAVRLLYPRLDPALAARTALRLRPQGDLQRAAYPLVRPPPAPAAMVIADQDEIFRTEWSRWVGRNVLGVEPIALAGGHFPMLESPERLAGLLHGLAERPG